MPRPALAPIRQRLPTEITSVPPPERVPMIEAPPPTSESASTTTLRGDPALDHRGPERPGVVVDEPLVHDGRALGQVGAEPDPVGVADADAGGQHVVDHPRELVHAVHGHPRPAGHQPGPGLLEVGHRARSGGGPHDVGEQAEDALHRDRPRPDEPVAEQVQPQPGVLGGRRRRLQVGDLDQPHLAGHPAYVVRPGQRRRARPAPRCRPATPAPAPGTRRPARPRPRRG